MARSLLVEAGAAGMQPASASYDELRTSTAGPLLLELERRGRVRRPSRG